jgi:hypothetical protein
MFAGAISCRPHYARVSVRQMKTAICSRGAHEPSGCVLHGREDHRQRGAVVVLEAVATNPAVKVRVVVLPLRTEVEHLPWDRLSRVVRTTSFGCCCCGGGRGGAL